ncbi:hypothetical protein Ancab_029947 [Ancistrocladus abbreviatus]
MKAVNGDEIGVYEYILGWRNCVHFVVANSHGQRWRLVCSKRTRPGSHPKPEVGGKGWRSFVPEAHVRTGDELFFYDSQVPEVNFTVRIFRTTKIFGQLIKAPIGK